MNEKERQKNLEELKAYKIKTPSVVAQTKVAGKINERYATRCKNHRSNLVKGRALSDRELIEALNNAYSLKQMWDRHYNKK